MSNHDGGKQSGMMCSWRKAGCLQGTDQFHVNLCRGHSSITCMWYPSLLYKHCMMYLLGWRRLSSRVPKVKVEMERVVHMDLLDATFPLNRWCVISLKVSIPDIKTSTLFNAHFNRWFGKMQQIKLSPCGPVESTCQPPSWRQCRYG